MSRFVCSARPGVAIAALAIVTTLFSAPVDASQVVEKRLQEEARDAAGRLTREAAIIWVIDCNGTGENGGRFFIYQLLKRSGWLTIKPPDWGHPIGGHEVGSGEAALDLACAQSPADVARTAEVFLPGAAPVAIPPAALPAFPAPVQPAAPAVAPPAAPRPTAAAEAPVCPGLAGPPLQQNRVLHMTVRGASSDSRIYYFNPQHAIYCGYGALASADFTGRYLRQEGNGFVDYVLVGGRLVRETFYDRKGTQNINGQVVDLGTYRGADNPARTGNWQAYWR